jgi:hypothetical protein
MENWSEWLQMAIMKMGYQLFGVISKRADKAGILTFQVQEVCVPALAALVGSSAW